MQSAVTVHLIFTSSIGHTGTSALSAEMPANSWLITSSVRVTELTVADWTYISAGYSRLTWQSTQIEHRS